MRGSGCVPIYNLMEDAATAEISRTQVWQWMHHGSKLSDGRAVTAELVSQETAKLLEGKAQQGKFAEAGKLFEAMMTRSTLSDFLTLEAYRYL